MRKTERDDGSPRTYLPQLLLPLDVAAFDLFAQGLHQLWHFFKMRIDRKRLAEGIERALVVADILHDHAKACESAEMAGLANQDLLDIGERASVIVLQIVERRAPIPRLRSEERRVG